MKIYDRLAGKLGMNPSKILSREETLRRIPTLEPRGLQRGVEYYDGQFDDSRLAVNLAQTIFDLGGIAVNYMPWQRLSRNGLVAAPCSGSRVWQACVRAKVVVNATGSSPIPSGKWMSQGRRVLSRPARNLTSF
jgi:glycerol-3-phosphate dehydrogenase